MLVLTRKPNEQIQIGDNITVTVLRIQGNTVRLGLQAPREVRVVRGELKRHGEPATTTEPAAPAPQTVAAVVHQLEHCAEVELCFVPAHF